MNFVWEISLGNMLVFVGVTVACGLTACSIARRLRQVERLVKKTEDIVAHRDFEKIIEKAVREYHEGK
jgi:hypothetical protein